MGVSLSLWAPCSWPWFILNVNVFQPKLLPQASSLPRFAHSLWWLWPGVVEPVLPWWNTSVQWHNAALHFWCLLPAPRSLTRSIVGCSQAEWPFSCLPSCFLCPLTGPLCSLKQYISNCYFLLVSVGESHRSCFIKQHILLRLCTSNTLAWWLCRLSWISCFSFLRLFQKPPIRALVFHFHSLIWMVAQ